MVFQDIYFWLCKINELKERDKYYTAVFNYLKYSRDKAVPCDNLTSNRPSLLFESKSRSPLTPLNNGGTKNILKLPRSPGNLGRHRLEDKRHLLGVRLLSGHGLTSFPVASELILPEIRTRQCRFPTINPGRETAVPCPLYHSGAAGIDITHHLKSEQSFTFLVLSTSNLV